MKDYKKIVETILKNHPDARDSDFRLFGWVCANLKPEVMDMPFKQVMWQHKELDMPSFDTIQRTRQKLQHDKPELRGKNYEKRMEKQSEYIQKFGRRYA